MQQLVDEPTLRDRMSNAALARMRTFGGWDRTDQLLVETLRGIIEASRPQNLSPAT